MDEQEFRHLLDLFPVVRPRDYHAELDSSRQSTSHSASNKALTDWQDAWSDGERNGMENQETELHDKFWQKLKLIAERKVGAAEVDKFCQAFQNVHKKLVYQLSFDAAQKFLN
ncbi:uncharacterized protein LOC111303890 [Durio zibethinus]|uniref:Uncharacterized protein LOC111303890 n=1 Tax=Durio zibethinus TaxID=66656 RepID=A0A6P5ZTQ1_DURZI|nr:uncharacterized protein LOC111303890 [Durio zibethinus]